MGLLSKEQIRELIKEKQLVTAQDMFKEMFADTQRKASVQSMENWNWRFHVTGRASSSRQW